MNKEILIVFLFFACGHTVNSWIIAALNMLHENLLQSIKTNLFMIGLRSITPLT
jgi:hypothetical protein